MMKGYTPWRGQLDAMMERHAIDHIESEVRRHFAKELSAGGVIPDSVLQDMRRTTAEMLATAKVDAGVQQWRQLNWWRDPLDPTRAVMYS
jgi:hypothetical protein